MYWPKSWYGEECMVGRYILLRSMREKQHLCPHGISNRLSTGARHQVQTRLGSTGRCVLCELTNIYHLRYSNGICLPALQVVQMNYRGSRLRHMRELGCVSARV